MGYTGRVAVIPAGAEGLNDDENKARIPYTALTRAKGVVFTDGVIRKEPGAVAVDSNGIAGAPTVLAGYAWRPTDAVQRIITACSDGKIYKEVSGDLDSVTLATGLSSTARGIFVPAGAESAGRNRKLFYFNGTNAVQVLSGDGTSMTAIANPPTDWSGSNQPLCGIVHGPRLFGFGNLNDPHRIYGSGPADHEDLLCATKVQLACFPGVGQRLVAAVGHKGVLYRFKYPKGIFWLNDEPTRTADWTLHEITREIGVAQSPYAALNVGGQNAIFLSAEGSFHVLSVLASGGIEESDLTDKLKIKRWVRENVALDRLNQVVSLWDEAESTAIFVLPKAGSTVNNLRLMFDFSDFRTTGAIKFSWSERDTAEALFLRKDTDGLERPAIGDNAGKVWMLNQAARTKGGAYAGEYQTAETDLRFVDPGLACIKKNADWLELEFNPPGAASTLTVEVYFDGTLSQTLSFNANTRRHRQRLVGSFYRISLLASNAVNNADFSVVEHRIGFRPGS